MTSRRFLTLLLGAIALILASCGGTPPAGPFPQANVFLITIDTLRADRLSVYGYDQIETPNIDAFASESVLFERAFSQAPLTLPSHASLFTGQQAAQHGVRENVGFKLGEQSENLAEYLKDKGYRTGGAVSTMVLRRSTGIAQGFDFYDDNLGLGLRANIRTYQERPGKDTAARLKAFLNKASDQPTFAWLHIFEPHTPYAAPAEFARKYPTRPYDAEVAYADHLMGEFFNFLKEKGLYENAIIILHSDHGEGLGDHGEAEHGLFTYREAIHVPLIIRLPSAERAGQRISQNVALTDIKATVQQLLGHQPTQTDGLNIINDKLPERPIYAETRTGSLNYGWYDYRSVIQGDLHYQEGYEPELFDLDNDFLEKNNLFGTRKIPDTATALMDQMAGAGNQETTGISDEEKAMLESLGYTGSFQMSDSAKSMPPKDFLATYNAITSAQRLINQNRLDDAEKQLNALLQKYPGIIGARNMLGQTLFLQKKYERAEYVTMEALALAPNHEGLVTGLTGIKLALNKVDEADLLAQKALEIAPLLSGRKIVLLFFEAGHYDHAARYAQSLKEFDPETAFAFSVLSNLARNDVKDAMSFVEQGLQTYQSQLSPDQIINAIYYLGDSLARMGHYDESLTVFLNNLQRNPDHGPTRDGLVKIYASKREPRKAIEIMDTWVRDYPTRANYLQAARTMTEIGMTQAANFYRGQAENYE